MLALPVAARLRPECAHGPHCRRHRRLGLPARIFASGRVRAAGRRQTHHSRRHALLRPLFRQLLGHGLRIRPLGASVQTSFVDALDAAAASALLADTPALGQTPPPNAYTRRQALAGYATAASGPTMLSLRV